MIDLPTACDIVDTYGPYERDWLAEHRGDLNALEVSDEHFADYLREMRALEDQLSAWKDDSDGVDVGEEADGGAGSAETNEGDDTPINFDIDSVKDMDEMFAAFIENEIAQTYQPYRVFTKDLDELTEIPSAGVSLDRLQTDTASAIGPLQKELARLIAAKTNSIRLPGLRRGRLNSSSLHRVVSGDDRVFYRKQEAPALDTAVSIVIDCSGSMREGGGSGWQSTRMALAVKSAFALASVLNRINVPFEVIGYTTLNFRPDDDYREDVERANAVAPITRFTPLSYPKFKTFDEPFSMDVQRRFARVYESDQGIAMGATIEGCSVDFAARRLVMQPAKRKLMIVLSDGLPQGPVFPGGGGMSYRQHAEETVKAVTKAGIDIVGVGIQHAAVTTYYPASVVISNLQEMPAKLMGVLKKFLID